MAYDLEGRLLEVCDCNVLCPCWIGEDPDNGTCQSALAYRIDKGSIDGVDVSGRTCAVAAFIPGNVLAGNLRVDPLCRRPAPRPSRRRRCCAAFRGEMGGPLADLAQLVGEEVDARRAPITFTVDEGKGTLTIGDAVLRRDGALSRPDRRARRQLVESIFSTIPGSPAYVGKASALQAWCSRRSGSTSISPGTTRSRALPTCPPDVGSDACWSRARHQPRGFVLAVRRR